MYIINFLFIIILIGDCILSNMKAFYSHGQLVTHPRLIVKRYLKVRVWIDLIAIASLCIPIISQDYVLNWVKVFFLLKIYSLYEIDN